MGKEIDYYGAFIRQRRSLFLTSALLIVYHLFHPSLGEISFANISVELIPHAQILIVAMLWILLVYFWYRFWLYAKKVANDDMRRTTQKNIEPAAKYFGWKEIKRGFPNT